MWLMKPQSPLKFMVSWMFFFNWFKSVNSEANEVTYNLSMWERKKKWE